MTKLFQNKYRIASSRLQTWDYGSNASYFVTINCKNHRHFFGRVVDGEMELSEIGEIVKSEWIKTPEIRPDMNLELGEFVVMPNHFHAIIIIGKNEYNSNQNIATPGRDAMHRVSTTDVDTNNVDTANVDTTNIDNNFDPVNKFAPQSKNLASIMRGFKSAVTMNARKINPKFGWQPRFHDHIIRNPKSHRNIEKYIKNNPANWKKDRFYK